MIITESQGLAITLIVAFGAGFVRGFTGFGGPSFLVALLTWFYTPLFVIGKVLVAELASVSILAFKTRRELQWRTTAVLGISTMVTMPVGQWLLMHTDPEIMRRSIAAVILLTCLVMLTGFRYRRPLSVPQLIVLGLVAGVVFGASYVALVVVAAIMLGPYGKDQTRNLFIAWGFLIALWYFLMSLISGAITGAGIISALPAAGAYVLGTLMGSRVFKTSNEAQYRRVAMVTLIVIAVVSLLK